MKRLFLALLLTIAAPAFASEPMPVPASVEGEVIVADPVTIVVQTTPLRLFGLARIPDPALAEQITAALRVQLGSSAVSCKPLGRAADASLLGDCTVCAELPVEAAAGAARSCGSLQASLLRQGLALHDVQATAGNPKAYLDFSLAEHQGRMSGQGLWKQPVPVAAPKQAKQP